MSDLDNSYPEYLISVYTEIVTRHDGVIPAANVAHGPILHKTLFLYTQK